MKITKRQLRRIIKEEKRKLHESKKISYRDLRRMIRESLGGEPVMALDAVEVSYRAEDEDISLEEWLANNQRWADSAGVTMEYRPGRDEVHFEGPRTAMMKFGHISHQASLPGPSFNEEDFEQQIWPVQ